MVEINLVRESIGADLMYVMEVVEAGEVTSTVAFSPAKGEYENGITEYMEALLANGYTDESLEAKIIELLTLDKEELHTRFILRTLEEHYDEVDRYK